MGCSATIPVPLEFELCLKICCVPSRVHFDPFLSRFFLPSATLVVPQPEVTQWEGTLVPHISPEAPDSFFALEFCGIFSVRFE